MGVYGCVMASFTVVLSFDKSGRIVWTGEINVDMVSVGGWERGRVVSWYSCYVGGVDFFRICT